MESWEPRQNTNEVEAIEDGRIVRVSENYALREGLPILRKKTLDFKKQAPEDKEKLTFDDFRKPLKKSKNQVTSELVPNFHWEIMKRRRYLGLSRKQLGSAISENENTIKLLENGTLEQDDFLLINKVQKYLGINVRKDKKDFSESPRKLLKEKPAEISKQKKETSGIVGEDIELIE